MFWAKIGPVCTAGTFRYLERNQGCSLERSIMFAKHPKPRKHPGKILLKQMTENY
jgi:hypothetical protein